MRRPVNHFRPRHSSLSFEIAGTRRHQAEYAFWEHPEISIVDTLKDQLGFKNRSTVLRWIFAQLENEDRLSWWTLEMLSKESVSP